MITFFQKLSETWVAKLIMVLLGVSMMSVFGLGSVTSFWGKNNTAIKVGNQSITNRKLLLDFDRELRRMNAFGTYISAQEAVKQGMLKKLIQTEAYALLKDQLTESMGTIASDAAVKNYIVNNPSFQSATSGVFDRGVLTAYLRQAGLSEAQFAEDLRRELAQKHIFDALDAVAYVPPRMSEILFAYENEARDLTMLLVSAEDVKVSEKPTEGALKDYYAAMQEDFYDPEYRALSYVLITPETVAEKMTVPEKEIRKAYEEKKDLYSTPEKRLVKQILLKDETAAIEIKNGLTADNFEAVAKEKAGQTQEETDFGWVTKEGVLTELSDVLFKMKKGEISGPVQTNVGFHILLVADIEPAKLTPLVEVKDELIAQIKAASTYDLMYEKAKKMDEQIGAGIPLEQAATSVGMQVEKIAFVDAGGMQKNGEKVFFADNQEALQTLMKFKKGAVSPLISYGNGFMLLRTDEITPVTLKPFEEVREILVDVWTKNKQKEALKGYAERIFSEVQKGAPISRVAKKYVLHEEDLKDVNKRILSETFGENGKSLFNLKEGGELLMSVSEEAYVIVRVLRIKDADPDEDIAIYNLAQKDFTGRAQVGMSETFMASFAKTKEIKVNDDAISSVFSAYLTPTEE